MHARLLSSSSLIAGAAALTVAMAAPLAAAEPAAEPATLTIVHFNDLDRMGEDDGAGGVARLASVAESVRRLRAETGGTVLVTHGGDSISPSLLSGFDQGAHMITLLNQVGLDAMALGNHEFDFGPDILAERIAEAEFPMLSNNAVAPGGGLLPGVEESLMIEVGPYSIGIFGLTTAGTAEKSSPGDVTFRDPVEVAEEMAASLREAGADLVIALAHTDVGEDRALYADAPVDLILSGDDHDLRVQYSGGKALVESGAQAEFVTVIDIALNTVEGRRGPEFTWTPAFEAINTAAVEPDTALTEAVATFEAFLSAELDLPIGETETPLDTTRGAVRGGENAFGNLVVDAMRAATGADFALTNGGGIRADRTYAPGTMLTRRDILSELPFGNKTVVLELTGAALLAAFENGVSAVEDGAGRFPHISGAFFAYDLSKEPGARVIGATVDGVDIDPAATYTLATNDFLAKGGDGYASFAGAPQIIDARAGTLMATHVIQFVEAAGSVTAAVEGRITRLEE